MSYVYLLESFRQFKNIISECANLNTDPEMKWAFLGLVDALGDSNFRLTRNKRYEIKYFDLNGTEISRESFQKLNVDEKLPLEEESNSVEGPQKSDSEGKLALDGPSQEDLEEELHQSGDDSSDPEAHFDEENEASHTVEMKLEEERHEFEFESDEYSKESQDSEEPFKSRKKKNPPIQIDNDDQSSQHDQNSSFEPDQSRRKKNPNPQFIGQEEESRQSHRDQSSPLQ